MQLLDVQHSTYKFVAAIHCSIDKDHFAMSLPLANTGALNGEWCNREMMRSPVSHSTNELAKQSELKPTSF